jgi:hypothetical protein
MRRLSAAGAVMLVCLALGGAAALAQEASSSATSSAGLTIEPLFDVTLGAEALPQELSGVLVFRKVYPADQEISYGADFIPPNTFARYVESGSLGLKPHGEMTVIRDASTAPMVERMAAESETTVEPGDLFILSDVPYDEHGKDALGTMWHEGTEDAQVVGFAIRESSRCCSMSHSGMRSPWYATLAGDRVEAMIGQPIIVTMRRLYLEPGTILPQAGQDPTMWLVEEGGVTVSGLPSEPDGKEISMEVSTGSSFSDRTIPGTDSLTVTNTGSEPATLLETVVEPETPGSE